MNNIILTLALMLYWQRDPDWIFKLNWICIQNYRDLYLEVPCSENNLILDNGKFVPRHLLTLKSMYRFGIYTKSIGTDVKKHFHIVNNA
jgi:hypothetical protein